MQAYRIADEPRPGGLAPYAVRPMWPLFAVMFAGPWISWPWFVLNGLAVGSPTMRREIGLAVLGFGGSLLLALAIFMLPRAQLPYGMLLLTVWKLGISYWLYALQSRSFGIYEYYGGTVKNGVLVVVLASLFGGRLLGGLFNWSPVIAVVFN